MRQEAAHVRVLSISPAECRASSHVSVRPVRFFFLAVARFSSIETRLCSFTPGSGFGKCGLSVLLSDLCPTLTAGSGGLRPSTQLLGSHLQMKTTWPAAQMEDRWEKSGGGTGQPGAAAARHVIFLCPWASLSFNPSSLPESR